MTDSKTPKDNAKCRYCRKPVEDLNPDFMVEVRADVGNDIRFGLEPMCGSCSYCGEDFHDPKSTSRYLSAVDHPIWWRQWTS